MDLESAINVYTYIFDQAININLALQSNHIDLLHPEIKAVNVSCYHESGYV